MEQNKNHTNYTLLDEVGHDDGYRVPDDYFATLASRVEEVVGMSPLDEVEDGYFEGLHDDVVARSSSRNNVFTRVVTFPYKLYGIGIAAMFALFVMVNTSTGTEVVNEDMSVEKWAADIDMDDAIDYLSAYDDVELMSLIDEEVELLDANITEENEMIYIETALEELTLDELEDLL